MLRIPDGSDWLFEFSDEEPALRGSKIRLDPVEVERADGLDGQHKKLRYLVSMQLVKALFEGNQLICGGLQQEQGLGRGLHGLLPTVDRLNRQNHCCAGSEALFHKRAAQTIGVFGVGGGG